jgi:hypothetical protein
VALALLQHAAGEPASGAGVRIDWGHPDIERQWQHIFAAGLAPLLYRATQPCFRELPASRQDALLGAELTARVRHGNLLDTASEVIDVCGGLRIQPTLLKGISISELCYPAGHLRPMGDIDVLVPSHAGTAVEEALLDLGYRRGPDHRPSGGQNHGTPLHHPDRDVWVEVHSALFPPQEGPGTGGMFGTTNVESESILSVFQGRPVRHLSRELQLAYIAHGWLGDMLRCKPHPSFLPSLFDVIFLLHPSRPPLDWTKVLGWLHQEPAGASLYVMLSYLAHLELLPCPPAVLSEVASQQRTLGPPELRVIHSILDRHVLGGDSLSRFLNDWHAMICLNTLLRRGSRAAKFVLLPWNALFPPQLSGRYDLRLQLGRVRRLLRGNRRPNGPGDP